jgi:hypothetical protein
MKKLLILIFSLFYITASSGVMINLHYCMGEFVRWDFSHHKDQHCANCGMKESKTKDCCKNEQKILKIDDAQKSTNTNYQLPLFIFSSLPALVFETTYVGIRALTKEPLQSNALLRRQNLPLFILHRVFRL